MIRTTRYTMDFDGFDRHKKPADVDAHLWSRVLRISNDQLSQMGTSLNCKIAVRAIDPRYNTTGFVTFNSARQAISISGAESVC